MKIFIDKAAGWVRDSAKLRHAGHAEGRGAGRSGISARGRTRRPGTTGSAGGPLPSVGAGAWGLASARWLKRPGTSAEGEEGPGPRGRARRGGLAPGPASATPWE